MTERLTSFLPDDWRNAPEGTAKAALARHWLGLESSVHSHARDMQLDLLADLASLEEQVRHSYTGRYVMELLQNAHDACADAGTTGIAAVVVSESALLVADEGIGFTPSRIKSLTRVGTSEKADDRDDRHTIGYKGIGFTAVFEASDRPQIIGRDIAFQFDTERLRALFGAESDAKRIPVRYFPFPLTPVEWAPDASAVSDLFNRGAKTVVRLPHRSGISSEQVRKAVRESVRPELLLFMESLAGISVDTGEKRSAWIRRTGRVRGSGRVVEVIGDEESQRWLVHRGTVDLSPSHAKALDDSLWAQVRKLNVAVALPWDRGRPSAATRDSRVFAYFPTDDVLGRSVLVHGDFYLDPSRRHVEGGGAPGVISEQVAAEAARLIATIAVENAPSGPHLVRALAPSLPATGFGQTLGKRIDEQLANTNFVLAGPNRRPRLAQDLWHVAFALPSEDERILAAVLSPASDVADPTGAPREVRAWLESLGLEQMPADEAARRVTLRRLPPGVSYASGLRLLSRWIESLDWVDRHDAVAQLRDRPIIRASGGGWTTPKRVVMHADAPLLPAAIRRNEASLPRDDEARRFLLDTIGVDLLTAASALEYLLRALVGPTFPRTEVDRQQTLAFVKEVWRRQPALLDRPNIGIVPVPTRMSGRRKVYWREANATYFSKSWVPGSTAEGLYGPLGEPEFLADPPPALPSDRRSAFALYEKLGVTASPRMLPLSAPLVDPLRWKEWRALPEVAPAFECDEGHTGSTRTPEGDVLDRLDVVLQSSRTNLVEALLSLDDPYGSATWIKCGHSSHSQRSGRKRVEVGYHDWRLSESAWVPVVDDPTGRVVRRPREAWSRVTASRRGLMVPRAAVRRSDAARLRLIDAELAPPAAIESALVDLADAYPELQSSPPGVEYTARWLMNRLDRVTERGQKSTSASAPPLPAHSRMTLVWDVDPLIADLPGLDAPDLRVLAPGRWQGLRRTYGLKRMSEVVAARVDASTKRGEPLLLPVRRRAQLLAFLNPVVADSTRVAGALASLREAAASRLAIRWRAAGSDANHESHPNVWLDVQRDQRGARIGATLYRLIGSSVDFVALGGMLAEYMDELARDMDIAQFLSGPERLLEYRGITVDDIDDAERVLVGRRRFVADPSRPPPSESDVTPGMDGPAEVNSETRGQADVLQAGEDGYIDPRSTGFGSAQSVVGQDVASVRREWQPPTDTGTDLESSHEFPPGPAPSGVIRRDERAEKTAIAIVQRYALTELGATRVIDRQADNVGWDLEFVFPDGRMTPVEVKGSGGEAPFRITPNERAAAETTPEYSLYFVTGTARAAHQRRLIRIDNFGSQITEGRIQVTDWVVTGWESMTHLEIPLDVD